MLRMELACFIVVALMAVLYFSSKREKTVLHKIYSLILIVSMLHLCLDAATVYTVNRLGEVSLLLNNVLHKLFIGSMVFLFYLIYRYIGAMISENQKSSLLFCWWGNGVFFLALLGIAFLPISYMVTEQGNYSYGPAAYVTYASIAVYLVMVVGTVLKHREKLHPKKRLVIFLAMGIEVAVSLYQAFVPLALLSGMGIMLIVLSLYFLMENPDIRLADRILEEKEKADAANASKTVFLSYVSHEIRTPMNAILGMTDVLLRTDMDEEQKEYLNNIKVSGDALVFIINNLLDISKIEAGKMELVPVDYSLEKEISNIKMMMRDRIGEKDIVLVCEMEEDVPRFLYGDGMRIRQVLINLLSNAVKYTDRGQIKLSVQKTRQTGKEVGLRFSVADTGIGIKPEDMMHLFDMFEQFDQKKNAGKEGTGLGLAISKALIELMGGKLMAESEYGKGSEFCFEIIQEIGSEESVAAEAEKESFIAPKAKVLLVDDDMMNRKVAKKILEPLQLKVETAENGKQALIMLESKEYHMVFMDHMMPVMDGTEATLQIRQKEEEYYKKLPVIALTANALAEAEKIFYQAGMNDVLTKPIAAEKINEVIKKWLPEELITVTKPQAEGTEVSEEKTENIPVIEGLNVEEGIKYSGNLKLYLSLLRDFYILIDAKTNKIRECLEDGLLRDYTIEVHALKNSARLIGAKELSEEFACLEKYGNEKQESEIHKHTERVLEMYCGYKEILKPYSENTVEAKVVSKEEIKECLREIRMCIDAFDIETADSAMEELEKMKLPGECESYMEKLRVYMADVALEDILNITDEMIDLLEKNR